MPNMPSHNDDDEDDEILSQEEIQEILGQFPEAHQMTPMDCCVMAGFLLDMNIPVPVDIIAKAHAAGLYIAH